MPRIISLAAAGLLLCSPAALAQDTGSASAVLKDQSGIELGTVTLIDMDGGIHLSGELTGVPNGEHGFHIHETGICDAPGKFESAGNHFEPGTHKHGKDNPDGPHAGDLLNVVADNDGKAVIDLHAEGIGVEDLNDADGAALVLHADPDDYTTDPAGNSGDRFACGVLEFAAP